MHAIAPAALPSLSSAAIARRLTDLCRAERNLQADFLLHLAAFDERRAYLEAGYGSLWTYCLEALHLRESAAGRRIAAMKVLRRLPALEAPLRDGRLCLSTAALLGPVLTEENLERLVAQAAFKSKADTEKLLVSIQPRVAPAEGIRRLPSSGSLALATGGAPGVAARSADVVELNAAAASSTTVGAQSPAPPAGATTARSVRGPDGDRAEIRPISDDLFSLRVTIDASCKAELDLLISLLSHSTRGKLSAVLREAIRCAIAKHGKRKGLIEPERKRVDAATRPAANGEATSAASGEATSAATSAASGAARTASSGTNASAAAASATQGAVSTTAAAASTLAGAAGAGAAGAGAGTAGAGTAGAGTDARGAAGAARGPGDNEKALPPGTLERETGEATAAEGPVPLKRRNPRAIPMAVRRAVWKRDGRCCAWTAPDGKRCGSTWKLELDHIRPVALGGAATLENIRVACIAHNQFHAIQTFGLAFMTPFLGEFTTPGGSDDK